MNLFKLSYIAFLILVSHVCVFSQDKTINISADDRSYYARRNEAEKSMNLPDMTLSKEGRYWRFWYDKYLAGSFVIDVMGRDSLNCKAFVTIYTYGDVVWDEKKTFSKIYHEQVSLEPEVAHALYRAASRVDIGRFARKDTLENSVRRYEIMDAFPYTVEYANEKNFYFRTGLRPENKAQFNAVIDTAAEFIDFEKLKDNFEKNIPFGYYSSSKWTFIKHELTQKQIRKYKRYWRKQEE